MIDLNDHQLDEDGQRVPLLANQKFKDEIEKKKDHRGDGCPGLKNAKYIFSLGFVLNIAKLYDKTKPIEE